MVSLTTVVAPRIYSRWSRDDGIVGLKGLGGTRWLGDVDGDEEPGLTKNTHTGLVIGGLMKLCTERLRDSQSHKHTS